MTNHVANELSQIIDEASRRLNLVSDDDAGRKPENGKWCKKEILGHLIDSAANNHHRFIRAQEVQGEFNFPKYDQDRWVASQGYESSNWTDMIEFWTLYNRHLARVIERIPEGKLEIVCTIGPYDPVTLGFLVDDYLVHTKHHLQQLEAI